ncbi:2Fe-2S iron-sulfur cluster-binding protein [Mycobacterium tuberculosis]
MSTVEMDQAAPESAAHHPLPDPGESRLALPTIGIFLATLTAFVGSTTAISADGSRSVTIPVNAAVTFVMFTVVHDASHYAISSIRWVNGLFGRLRAFRRAGGRVPGLRVIHIQHHRHSNDDEQDRTPSPHTARGAAVALVDGRVLYIKVLPACGHSRPVIESPRRAMMTVPAWIVAIVTGNFWTLAIVFPDPATYRPYRAGLVVPTGCPTTVWRTPSAATATARPATGLAGCSPRCCCELPLGAPPAPVGAVLPVPAHLAAQRGGVSGTQRRDLHGLWPATESDEYRRWKELNGRLARLLPVRDAARSSSPHAVLHRIPVASVDPITADATLVTFAVPEALRDAFRFEPGQHVAVRTDLGGQGIRRNYSICAPATRAQLRIAVKHIPGGAFSTFVANELKAGDVLELMTPTGRFGTPLDPLHRKHYVGLVAGSGITPVLSILATTLEIETESRFTLIYGNRTKESTMFRAELDRLESRYADRLEILHVLSSEPLHTPELRGRIDRDKLTRWLTSTLRPAGVDEWFICGPLAMATAVRETLIEHGVDSERIHLELFYGFDTPPATRPSYAGATVTFTLSGQRAIFDLVPGDSILEGALGLRSDAPYACMGGACGTCRAKLIEGNVEMDHNFALRKAELDAGYILTCQSHPTTPCVAVDYDDSVRGASPYFRRI